MSWGETMGEDWNELLDKLQDQVLQELQGEAIEDESEFARLAADYKSYCRMGHAPARAVRLAEQLLFQRGQYRDREALQALALAVTARLALIYRDWQNRPEKAAQQR